MKNISLIIFLGCIAISAAVLSVPLSKQNREKRFLFGLFGNDHHHHHDDHHHDDHHHGHYDDHYNDHGHGHNDDHGHGHGHWRAKRDATKDVPETESLTASHKTREKRFLFGLFGNDHHHHHDDYDHHHHHDDHHHGHYDDHYNDHGHGHGHYDDHGHGHWRAKRHDDKDIPKKEGTYNAGIIHKKSPKN